jgi:hypothetical protein
MSPMSQPQFARLSCVEVPQIRKICSGATIGWLFPFSASIFDPVISGHRAAEARIR